MFTKHDSTVLLEILSAFSIVGILSISFFLFSINSTLQETVKNENKKITISDLSPELVKEINGQFGKLANFQDIVGFYFQNLLTKEQIDALNKAYSEKQNGGIPQSQGTPPVVSPNTIPSPAPVASNPPSATPAQ